MGTLILGLDPGLTGAAAWLTTDGALVDVLDLPIAEVKVGKTKRRRLVPALFVQMLRRPGWMPIHVWLEEVATRPAEGAVGAFAFGRGFGQLEGAVTGLGIPCNLVRPQVWKRHQRLPAGRDGGALRAMACRLWPHEAERFKRVRDEGRAAAALIGLYGAHTLRGSVQLAPPDPAPGGHPP